MKKDEIILEGLGDSIGNEFTDLINIRVTDIAFPARKTGYIRWWNGFPTNEIIFLNGIEFVSRVL